MSTDNVDFRKEALLTDADILLNRWLLNLMLVHGSITVKVIDNGNRHVQRDVLEFSWRRSYGCLDLDYHPKPKCEFTVGVGDDDFSYRLVSQSQIVSNLDVVDVCQTIQKEIAKRVGEKRVRWRNQMGYCPMCNSPRLLVIHDGRFLCPECVRNEKDQTANLELTNRTDALPRVAERRKMTPSLRYFVLERSGFKCKVCGRTTDDGVKLHVDHIVPVSLGGKTVKSNLQCLCDECNFGKSGKMPTETSLAFMSKATL